MGAGGSQLQQVEIESGAEIEMGKLVDTSGDRIISIAGSEESIQLAVFLLQQVIIKEMGENDGNSNCDDSPPPPPPIS